MNGQQAVEQCDIVIYCMMDITFLTMESLILAQDERWRRASYMQVEREAVFGLWKVADG